jgi:hypothetical protein
MLRKCKCIAKEASQGRQLLRAHSSLVCNQALHPVADDGYNLCSALSIAAAPLFEDSPGLQYTNRATQSTVMAKRCLLPTAHHWHPALEAHPRTGEAWAQGLATVFALQLPDAQRTPAAPISMQRRPPYLWTRRSMLCYWRNLLIQREANIESNPSSDHPGVK